jgi:thioredoxin reductase (NADPH)
LVVGGRNSAVEAALRCWRAGAQVALSYRRAEFLHKWVKPSILPDLKTQIRAGNIVFYPETVPVEITPGHAVLAPVVEGRPGDGGHIQCRADFVLLCTGYVADLDLFQSAGVTLSGPERVPQLDPETMETNVPGLYVAGTAAAGDQRRYTLFIENCHQHVVKIVTALTGQPPEQTGTIAAREYEVPLKAIQAN